jgi:ArsR family transcriptional regulator
MVVDERTRTVRRSALKALAEPIRWQIVERLAHEDLCVCHLVDELALPQPLVSHHLKVLRQAGLVTAERYRQWTYHRLMPDEVAAVAGELSGLVDRRRDGERRRPCC